MEPTKPQEPCTVARLERDDGTIMIVGYHTCKCPYHRKEKKNDGNG
jgi:hypothetical protein